MLQFLEGIVNNLQMMTALSYQSQSIKVLPILIEFVPNNRGLWVAPCWAHKFKLITFLELQGSRRIQTDSRPLMHYQNGSARFWPTKIIDKYQKPKVARIYKIHNSITYPTLLVAVHLYVPSSSPITSLIRMTPPGRSSILGVRETSNPFRSIRIHLRVGVGIPASILHWKRADPPLTAICRSSG